jgi:hypothetical protein
VVASVSGPGRDGPAAQRGPRRTTLPAATENWIRMAFPLTSDPALKDEHGMEGVDVVEAGDVDPFDLSFSWVMPSRFQNAALLEKNFRAELGRTRR